MPKVSKKTLFRGKRFDLVQEAIICEKSHIYFTVMPHSQPKKWRFYQRYGISPSKAELAFRQRDAALRLRAEEMYYALSDNSNIARFSRFLIEKGIYSAHDGFRKMFNTFFIQGNSRDYKSYLKLKAILYHYGQFMKMQELEEVA